MLAVAETKFRGSGYKAARAALSSCRDWYALSCPRESPPPRRPREGGMGARGEGKRFTSSCSQEVVIAASDAARARAMVESERLCERGKQGTGEGNYLRLSGPITVFFSAALAQRSRGGSGKKKRAVFSNGELHTERTEGD